MKKLILTLALTVVTLLTSANEVRYFTRTQANRVARREKRRGERAQFPVPLPEPG